MDVGDIHREGGLAVKRASAQAGVVDGVHGRLRAALHPQRPGPPSGLPLRPGSPITALSPNGFSMTPQHTSPLRCSGVVAVPRARRLGSA